MPWHLLRTWSSLYPNILSYITRLKGKKVFLSLQKLLDSGTGSGGTHCALVAPPPALLPVVWFVKGLIWQQISFHHIRGLRGASVGCSLLTLQQGRTPEDGGRWVTLFYLMPALFSSVSGVTFFHLFLSFNLWKSITETSRNTKPSSLATD